MSVFLEDNEIVQGEWFGFGVREGVFVEVELVECLGLVLGDEFIFIIGLDKVIEFIISICIVQWDSMKFNFYMVFFLEGGLIGMLVIWIISFYLLVDQKVDLNEFFCSFLIILVLEIDYIIDCIQQIVCQVIQVIEVILVLILVVVLVVMVVVVSVILYD